MFDFIFVEIFKVPTNSIYILSLYIPFYMHYLSFYSQRLFPSDTQICTILRPYNCGFACVTKHQATKLTNSCRLTHSQWGNRAYGVWREWERQSDANDK